MGTPASLLRARLATINQPVEPHPNSNPAHDAPLSSRRTQIVNQAARLFARRGYHGVTIEEIGAAVGISGPAIYKHFIKKDAILADMLIGISRHLLEGGRSEVARATSPSDLLGRLVDFHTDFALSRPELIRVHEHDLDNLPDSDARAVRRLQRAYVELWVDALRACEPSLGELEARTRAHATFGLLNSTPHSVAGDSRPASGELLRRMAHGALGVAPVGL